MSVRLRRLPWTRRALRRGDAGEPVRWLQERLLEQGYEVGAVDGKYGFLTEEAVRAFQRDRRLRIDGLAGPQVLAALSEDLPRRRLVHVVQEGERLSEIAARYGLSLEALRWMNRLSPRERIAPGDRLVVWSTYVLAGLSPRSAPPVLERAVAAAAGSVSGLVAFGSVVPVPGASEPPGGDSFELPAGPWERFAGLKEGDGVELRAALMKRGSRKRLVTAVSKALSRREGTGLFLDPGLLAYGEGARYQRALLELRRAVPGRKLAAAVPLPAEGWKGLFEDFDYRVAGRVLDLAVLPFHRWETLWRNPGAPLSWSAIERVVALASRRLPPWRLLLGVPFGACVQQGAVLSELPYRAAVVAGYGKGKRFTPAGGGFLSMEVDGEEGRSAFLAQGRDAFARFLALAYRYRLAGIYLYPLSEEDSRLWSVLERRLKVMEPRPGPG